MTPSNSLASHRTKRPAIRNATSIANVPVSFAGCAGPHIRRATASAVWAISSGRSPRRLGPRERGPGLGECFSRGAGVRRRHSLTLPRSLCASSARGESGRPLSRNAIVARLARFGGTAPLSLGDSSSGGVGSGRCCFGEPQHRSSACSRSGVARLNKHVAVLREPLLLRCGAGIAARSASASRSIDVRTAGSMQQPGRATRPVVLVRPETQREVRSGCRFALSLARSL